MCQSQAGRGQCTGTGPCKLASVAVLHRHVVVDTHRTSWHASETITTTTQTTTTATTTTKTTHNKQQHTTNTQQHTTTSNELNSSSLFQKKNTTSIKGFGKSFSKIPQGRSQTTERVANWCFFLCLVAEHYFSAPSILDVTLEPCVTCAWPVRVPIPEFLLLA